MGFQWKVKNPSPVEPLYGSDSLHNRKKSLTGSKKVGLYTTELELWFLFSNIFYTVQVLLFLQIEPWYIQLTGHVTLTFQLPQRQIILLYFMDLDCYKAMLEFGAAAMLPFKTSQTY